MRMNNRIYDEIFNTKIKAAGYMLLDKIADEAPSEEELCGLNVSFDKIDSRVKASIRKISAKHFAKKAAKIFALASSVLILLVGIGIMTITHTQALPIKFKDILMKDNKTHVDLSASEEIESEEEFITKDTDIIDPGYLPDGFELVEVQVSQVFAVNTYLSRENNTIRLTKSKSAGSIAFDNERSTHYETEIMGNKAIVLENQDMNIVFYFSNNYFYEILGEYVDTQELIKIAQKLPA